MKFLNIILKISLIQYSKPNWMTGAVSKSIANERFRNCCQRLGEGCAQICSYDQTLTTVTFIKLNYNKIQIC